jgi:hypothetical protein
MDRTLRDKLLASLEAFWPAEASAPPLKSWVRSLVTREALFSRAEQLFNGGQWERIWTGAVSPQEAPVSPWVGWSVLQTMLGPPEVQPHTWPRPASRGIPIQGGTLWVDLHEPRRVKPCCCQGSSATPTRIAPRRKLPDAATLRWVDSSGRQRRTLNVPSYQALGGLLRAHLPAHASNSTWRQLSDELMRFQKRADQLGMDTQVSGPRESQASILRSQPASKAGREQGAVNTGNEESTDCSCTTVAVSQPCCAGESSAASVSTQRSTAARGQSTSLYATSDFGAAECPDDPQPASEAGLISGPGSCCVLSEVETEISARKVYYIASGGRGTGGRFDPAPLRVAQELLGKVSTFRFGLTILLRRGDTWREVASYDPLTGGSTNNLLIIRASGAEGHPIYIGAYTDPTAPSEIPPRLFGDGSIRPRNCGASNCAVTRATMTGIRISGGKYIQVQDLEITNFKTGIAVSSFYEGDDNLSPGYPTKDNPVRGARHITLRQLRVYENWVDGISLASSLDAFVAAYFNKVISVRSKVPLRNTGQVVIGDGTVELKVRNVLTREIHLHDIPADPQWWVEEVCVENCEIFANGDGECSNGGNISLLSLTSRCTFRHNEIYGARHSKDWPNACGQVILGYPQTDGCVTEASTRSCLWERDPSDPFLYTWGTDGITFSTGGCGNIIENNILRDHIVGQNSRGNCGTDDGNGIDIKASGNRTYWRSDRNATGSRIRRLSDMPNVIRNNVIKNNGVAIILHFGCRGIHIYNNGAPGKARERRKVCSRGNASTL